QPNLAPPVAPASEDESPVAPAVAAGVVVRWLDPAAAWAGTIGATPGHRHRAGAVARVRLLYDEDRAELRQQEEYEAVPFPLPHPPLATGFVPTDYDDRALRPEAPPAARYELPDAPVKTKGYWTALQKDLVDQLVRSRTVAIFVNRQLKLYGRV